MEQTTIDPAELATQMLLLVTGFLFPYAGAQHGNYWGTAW